MATGVASWSKTAASNASADSTVNWAEGMAPSAVNDSARAEMASVAKYRDDLNGSITTGGTSTAYTVTSNQGMALTAGYVVAFAPHATNGATVTLNADSLGAKPLRSAPGVELPSGVLVQGTPYAATYYTSNSGEWILHGFYGNPYSTPIGGLMPYLGATAPNSSFVLPYGQAVSRTTYSALFTLVSTTFGIGDGTTTFNLPDISGRAIFCKDDISGSAAGRITTAGSSIDGTTIGATGGAQNKAVLQANLPNVSFTNSGIGGSSTIAVTYDAHGGSISGGVGAFVTSSNPTSSAAFSATITPGSQGSAASGGSGTALVVMPPSIILPFILRII